MAQRGVAILGSTGSIGESALAVLRRQRDHFTVVALTGGRNAERLSAQVAEWKPAFAGLAVLLAAVGQAAGFGSWRLYLGVAVVLALYGLFDEATQALVRRREPDLYDWLADMTGALVGIVAFALFAKLWPAGRHVGGVD